MIMVGSVGGSYGYYSTGRLFDGLTADRTGRTGNTVSYSDLVTDRSSSLDFLLAARRRRQNIDEFYGAGNYLGLFARQLETAFSGKGVHSSDGAVSGTAKPGARVAEYELNITQLARGQQNISKSLPAAGGGAVAAGHYDIDVTVNGQTKRIGVDIDSGDSNRQALDKIARAVKGAGIDASVKSDGGKIYLAMTGKTGEGNAFSFSDVNGSLSQALNLNNKVQDGQNARFTVNGTAYDQAENRVVLDNGNVALSLNAAGNRTVRVRIGADSDRVTDGLRDVIDVYNTMVDILNGADGLGRRGAGITRAVQQQFAGGNGSRLSEIGVTLDGQGKIVIDEKKLSKALDDDPDRVRQLLAGPNGLAAAFTTMARQVGSTPPEQVFAPLQRYRPDYGGLFIDQLR
ncbi:MAG: flagellar filament capping protein FliD [Negativicutes bacterium]|nr:flagellar filament capping protein FliD [Negativicutes bacterium]